MLQELRLELGHIDIGRAFRFAAFAAEAKVHHLIDLPMVIPVGLRGVGQEFPQDISPRAGGVLLVAGGHEGGTHGAAGKLGFAAVAGTVALFRMLQDILAMEPEDRRKSRGLLTRFIAQHGIHRGGVHDLFRVEDIFRVPGML